MEPFECGPGRRNDPPNPPRHYEWEGSGFLRGLEYEGTPSNVTFAVTGVVAQAFTDSEENKMSYNEALENLPRAWNSFFQYTPKSKDDDK